MYQFDEYINSIIGDLKISKKDKSDIFEEFRDHLQMLKREYMLKGYSEGEAIKKAIESFGQQNDLKEMFNANILSYRNYITVFAGIFLILVLNIINRSIALPSFEQNTSSAMILSLSIVVIATFAPMGYFIPIIFTRINKISLIVVITLPLGIFAGIYLSLVVNSLIFSVYIEIIICSAIFSLTGSLIGYKTLKIINKLSLMISNVKYLKSII